MKKNLIRLGSTLVASILMATTALAAFPGVILVREKESNQARLYLTGLEDITSVELSLKSNQNLEGAHFLGQDHLAYGYHREKDGVLTLYADSLSVLEEENGQIYLGDLTLPDSVSFTGVAELITLNSKDVATTYTQVSLEDDKDEVSGGEDNNTGDSGNTGDNGNNGDSSNSGNTGGGNHDEDDDDDNSSSSGSTGGSGSSNSGSSGHLSSTNTTSSSTTGRPIIQGDQIHGMIVTNDDGSVSITPHEGYEVADVLVNGVSQGAVLQLLHLKSTDVVEVLFTPVEQTISTSTSFTDVPAGQWYAPAVSYVTQRGLFSGVSETEFAPAQSMTRGMLVSVLYRFQKSIHTGTSPFTDVSPEAWYGNAVRWAYANGLVLGLSETQFAPDAPITREQVAVMLARYLQFSGVTLAAASPDFQDTASISTYAKESVGAMQKAGLLSGDEEGNFRPDAQITRAEIASIFMRLCQTYGL